MDGQTRTKLTGPVGRFHRIENGVVQAQLCIFRHTERRTGLELALPVAFVSGLQVSIIALLSLFHLSISAAFGNPVMDTARLRITEIRRARFSIVTHHRFLVVEASHSEFARLRGAGISIRAIVQRTTDALPFRTRIPYGADFSVDTRGLVLGMLAPGLGIAQIIGARVIVLAWEGKTGNTFPIGTAIPHSTQTPVAAGPRRRRETASRFRIAGIRSTGIRVGTHFLPSRQTFPAPTDIARRTEISVLARKGVRLCHTSLFRRAGVFCAGIAIGTIHRTSAPACTCPAHGPLRAGISVIAGNRIRGNYTPNFRVAAVVRAQIPVIAIHPLSGRAHRGGAGIALGAGIAILTSLCIRGIGTAFCEGTGILRARISIVAGGPGQERKPLPHKNPPRCRGFHHCRLRSAGYAHIQRPGCRRPACRHFRRRTGEVAPPNSSHCCRYRNPYTHFHRRRRCIAFKHAGPVGEVAILGGTGVLIIAFFGDHFRTVRPHRYR